MKKNQVIRNIVLLLVVAIAVVGCIKKTDTVAKVEEMLPFSDKVIKGKLDNGMIYYIKENDSPEDKVELRLNVRSGSLNETDEERGLAHFVEHMAFNGTENFEGNEVIKFMEKAGLTFGLHSNAYTSYANTNYQLTIPTDDKELLDQAFFILRDWATAITFDKVEVDAEKGVILEELRSRNTSGQRLRLQSLQHTYAGSEYLERDPIGLEEIIINATPEQLIGYYEKWYQPENMSVMAVGDISPKEIEALIMKYLADIENKPTPTPVDRKVPLTEGTRLAIVSDEEATATGVTIMVMSKEGPVDTYQELKEYILGAGAMSMLSKRVANKIAETRSDLLSFRANKSMGSANELSIATINISSTPETLNDDVKSMLTEIESAKRFGFTIDELNEFLENQNTQLEQSADPNFKYPSKSYINGIVAFDTSGGHLTEFTQDKVLIDRIFKESNVTSYSNKFDKIIDSNNMLIIISVPTQDKDKVKLDVDGFKKIVAEVEKAELVAETDVKSIDKLIDKKPTAGKVVSRKKYDNVDGELVTYDNGVKLFIKKNDGTEKLFEFAGMKIGGTSIMSDEDTITMNMVPQSINASGFTDISPRQLQRFLAGKKAKVLATASDYTFDFSGGGSTDDMEITFQLLYKMLTSPTVDERAYEATVKTRRNALANYERDRERTFSRELATKMYNDNYRREYLLTTDLPNISKDDILRLYKEHYLDINNFTFVLSGDVDVEQVVELGATYLGSIKIDKKPNFATTRDVKLAKKDGRFEKNGQVANKSNVTIIYEGKDEAIENGLYYSSLVRRVLAQRLRERIREEISGVYGVSARMYYAIFPEYARGLSISFTTDPERKDELIKEAITIVKSVATGNITQEELDIAIGQQNTALKSAEERDSFWVNSIWNDLNTGEPILSVEETMAIYSNAKLKDVNAFAKEFLSDMSQFVAAFNPEVQNAKKN